MGIATFAIGLLPTYHQVGLLAPALLAVLRFTRDLRWAGNGAARHCWPLRPPVPEEAWAAMWPQLGAPIGFLMANGLFLVLIGWLGPGTASADLGGAFLGWGWRIPFLPAP